MSARAHAGWPGSFTQAKSVGHFVRMLGTGATTPTKVEGPSVTLNRTGAGLVEVIWSSSPGTYMGVVGFCFEATTPADLKGYSVVPGIYDATLNKITLSITNTADTLTDLAATQHLSITFAFRQTQSAG